MTQDRLNELQALAEKLAAGRPPAAVRVYAREVVELMAEVRRLRDLLVESKQEPDQVLTGMVSTLDRENARLRVQVNGLLTIAHQARALLVAQRTKNWDRHRRLRTELEEQLTKTI